MGRSKSLQWPPGGTLAPCLRNSAKSLKQPVSRARHEFAVSSEAAAATAPTVSRPVPVLYILTVDAAVYLERPVIAG